MASDLSSGCTDDIFDEKEEGEISLEDVSSSEESHPNYRSGLRATGRCPVCTSAQQCAPWCTNARAMRKMRSKRDAANGKENRHIKDSSGSLPKHVASTLQEKNDDLVPISSDSDMEIVGLPGNSKQLAMRVSSKTAKVQKKKKKKRSHSSVVRVEELSSPTEVETYLIEVPLVKTLRASKSRHGEPSSPRYSVRSPPIERSLTRSPSRRYRTRPLRSRSPLRRSRSPLARVETTERKSPRKFRSPHRPAFVRRSPTRTSAKTSLASRDHGAAPSSQTHIDIELLKKVRRLDSIGAGSPKNKLSRSKEHSSLKEKLSNMLKNHVEPSQEKPAARTKENTNSSKDNNDTEATGAAAVETADDEDDIELLRRLALETKQKRAESKIDQPVKVNSEITANNVDENLNDDNDNEAYELRLIALRSAIMKNHENRVKRGVKPKRRKKSKTRVESPFGKSFLDEIPIPGDDEFSRPVSPDIKSPIVDNNEDGESNHPEDMDLDTDVEREKEKDSMPYSPTDDVTRQIAVGADMPNLEFYDNNNEYTFPHCQNPHERQNDLTISNYIEARRYSPSAPTKTPTMEKMPNPRNDKETPCSPYTSDYEPGIDTPYSPPSPSKAPILDKLSSATNNKRIPYATDGSDYEPGVDTPYSPTVPSETPMTLTFTTRNNANITETPYSPTDTPICDLDIASPSPTDSAKLLNDVENCGIKNVDEKFKNSSALRNLASSMLNVTLEDAEDAEPTSKKTEIFPSAFSLQDDKNESALFISEPNKTIETIRTIEKLPEIDLDGSPLVPLSKEHESSEIVIPLETSPERTELAAEPLYLQGVPDVTKDSNKIPTLVNRTLVPAPILKTNKNLQQPLPPKKLDNHAEPTFKSADMRPVSVEETAVKPSALFKPIKLCPVSKKSQVMTTTAAAFNTSYDDSARENKSDDEPMIVEISERIEEPVTETKTKTPPLEKSHKADVDSRRKEKDRRKRLQQRNKRKGKSTCGRAESLSSVRSGTTKNNESNTSAKNRTNRGSSSSPTSRPSENSKNASSRKSKSGQTKASSSKSDRLSAIAKQTEASTDASLKKSAKKIRRERRMMRKIEASLGESINSRYENHSNKSTKELSPGEGTSTGVTRVKSSSPKIRRKSIEQNSGETNDKNKDVEDSSRINDQSVKIADMEKKRRCSLDDDEEALRALLLASLPKRQKPVEVPSTSANPVVSLPRLSDATTTDTSAENSAKKIAPKETTPSLSDAVFTPLNPPALSSQSSSASAATPTHTEVASALPKDTVVARKILVSDTSSVDSSSPRKRVILVPPKGPPKKIVKKALPVITSTKVVNNAKKYQNAMLQKKLNLQRAALIYSAQNGGSRNITLNNLKINEAARPTSPKISTASKMQRLIINLGSDTDTESEHECHPSSSTSGDAAMETRKPLAIPTTDFEKSVVQFLKDQRKKLESVAVVKTATYPTTTTSKSPAPSTSAGKLTGLYSTPLAVRRHLPMSQQEEYRRLKQQIMERERQKLQKTIEVGAVLQNRNSRSPCTPPGPLSPASPIAASQRLDNQKVSSVTNEGISIPSTVHSVLATSKDNILENNIASQQKITSFKANETPSIVNVTKVPAKLTPSIPKKLLTKITNLSKVNSINPIVVNTSTNAATPKVPEKILPKVNSVVPSLSKIPANTSTPKVTAKIAQVSSNFTISNFSSIPTSLPIAKSSVVATKEIRRKSGSPELPSVPTNTSAESLTSASSIGKARWSLGTLSVPSTSSTRRSSAPPTVRTSLHHTEMLTIQIPNDKVRTDKLASTENSRSSSNSPTMSGQSVGMLRVLTKEQLNNRFVQIQVKQGPAGRQVTFGGSSASPDVFAQSSRSPILNILPESSDKTNKTMCCDSSLIVNETNEAGGASIECANDAGRSLSDDTTVANSEASTLVISRNDGTSRNETNFDSTASTFVMVYANSERRDNLESARIAKFTGNSLPTKTIIVKPRKTQAKEVWDKIKSDVRNEIDILTRLPINEQQKLLMESQENLVAKRNMVLEDLTEMSGCLRRWEVEREIQTKLIAEVRRLREELRSAEERLHEQRRQMNGMGPRVTEAREKINHGRRECYKLSRICQGLGTKIIGDDYKVPNTGAQLLNERLREVAVRTGQLSKKKVSSIKPPSHVHDENSAMSSSLENAILSDISLVERPSHTTIGQNDSDDYRDTRENSVFSELSNATANDLGDNIETPSPDCERLKGVENDIEDSNSYEIIALTNETESSQSNDVISRTNEYTDANTLNTEKFDSSEKNESTSIEIITSSTPKGSAKESIEYISLPGTSRSEPPTAYVSTITQQQPSPAAKKVVDPYQSVLVHLKIPRNENPGGILCPYELMGTCNDGDCLFYHLDPRHCQ